MTHFLLLGALFRSNLNWRSDAGNALAPKIYTSIYKYLSDADKKNYFDVDRYLTALRRKRQRVVSQEETFDLYDIDLSDEDMAAVNE